MSDQLMFHGAVNDAVTDGETGDRHAVGIANGSTSHGRMLAAAEDSDDPLAAGPSRGASVDSKRKIEDVDFPAADRALAKRLRNLGSLPLSSLRSGLCYDVRMRFHATYATDDKHPEDPRRIQAIYDALRHLGLVEDPDDEAYFALWGAQNTLRRYLAREASREEICRVHEEAHYDDMEDSASTGPPYSHLDDARSMLTSSQTRPSRRCA